MRASRARLCAAPAEAKAPAPLGISYAGWKGDYRAAAKRLETIKAIGFQIVSFVPTYAYVGLDKIDLAAGPDAAELGAAVEAALRAGFTVVIKPHLDPPAYQPGFDPVQSDNHSWRVMCPWRGFYDLGSDGGRLPRGRRLRDVAHAQGRARSRGRGGADAGPPGGRRRADELRRLHAGAVGAAAGRRQEGAPPAGPRRQGPAVPQLHAPHRDRRRLRRAHERAAQEGAGPLHPRPRRAVAVAVHGPDGGGAGGRSRQPPARARRRSRRRCYSTRRTSGRTS